MARTKQTARKVETVRFWWFSDLFEGWLYNGKTWEEFLAEMGKAIEENNFQTKYQAWIETHKQHLKPNDSASLAKDSDLSKKKWIEFKKQKKSLMNPAYQAYIKAVEDLEPKQLPKPKPESKKRKAPVPGKQKPKKSKLASDSEEEEEEEGANETEESSEEKEVGDTKPRKNWKKIKSLKKYKLYWIHQEDDFDHFISNKPLMRDQGIENFAQFVQRYLSGNKFVVNYLRIERSYRKHLNRKDYTVDEWNQKVADKSQEETEAQLKDNLMFPDYLENLRNLASSYNSSKKIKTKKKKKKTPKQTQKEAISDEEEEITDTNLANPEEMSEAETKRGRRGVLLDLPEGLAVYRGACFVKTKTGRRLYLEANDVNVTVSQKRVQEDRAPKRKKMNRKIAVSQI